MTTWQYEAGQWTETTFLDDAWQDAGGKTWGAVLKDLGYEHYTEISAGRVAAFEITVYRREEPPRFIVQIADGNIWDAVTTSTLPDALDLLARYAPIVTASEIASAISDIRDLESWGIVTEVLASAELNQGAVQERVRLERQDHAEQRRAMQERKRQEPQ